MNILSLVLRSVSGLVTLLYGKKLFWLFLFLAGFLVGFLLGPLLFPNMDLWHQLLIGLGIGVVMALLSKSAPVVITAIIAFFAGGSFMLQLVENLVPLNQFFSVTIYIVAGILTVFLATKLFELSLTVISSLLGASTLARVIHELLPMGNLVQAGLIIALAIVGILFQLSVFKSDNSPEIVKNNKGSKKPKKK